MFHGRVEAEVLRCDLNRSAGNVAEALVELSRAEERDGVEEVGEDLEALRLAVGQEVRVEPLVAHQIIEALLP